MTPQEKAQTRTHGEVLDVRKWESLDDDEREGLRRVFLSDRWTGARHRDQQSPLCRWAYAQPCSSSVSLAVLDSLRDKGLVHEADGHRLTARGLKLLEAVAAAGGAR